MNKKGITNGLGWSILMGAVTGFAGEFFSEGHAAASATQYDLQEMPPEARSYDSESGARNLDQAIGKGGLDYVPESRWKRFWLAGPGTIFSAIDAGTTAGNWQPIW